MTNSIFSFFINIIIAAKETTSETAVTPLYSFLTIFGPLMMGLLGSAGTIYCIVLGVQYSKAEKTEERDVAKKKMINAAIGFLTIIILIAILYGIRAPLAAWMKS